MKNYMTALLAFLVFMGGSVPKGYAEEKTKFTPPRMEMLDHATMEMLTKEGEASEQSRILASLIGTWNFDLKFWTKKDADPQTSSGSVRNEMTSGNRFLSSKMMTILNIGGENLPYEGWSLIGYDSARKAYTSVLIDTLRTGMTAGSGQYNEKLKTLEQKGHFTFPLTDKERAYRSELEFIASDAYMQTVFITDKSGKEFKALEIKFKWQK